MSSTEAWTPVRWAENGKIRLAYDRLATGGDGEPLLLITGLGASRRWMPDGMCERLAAQGFAVARYDQRDAGESTHLPPAATRNPFAALFGKRGDAYTAEDTADDAISVLDALGWPSAHLFGQSLGGAVAQRIALRHPDRVRTLTSMSAVPGDAAGLGTLRYLRMGTLARFTRVKFPDTPEGAVEAGLAVARICASPGYPFDERKARETAERIADAGIHDPGAQSRQIGAQWSGPSIDSITVPTLVLHGDGDPLIRLSAARKTAARIPGARLIVLPGVGHEIPRPVWNEIAVQIRELADTSSEQRGRNGETAGH
ncbi:alpha/beta fold hydrolase [Actinoallomurus sp. NBC_01490]|uniref:alpha/beta fold hydrolase n=1 Tax=Actinoallomurus sp. NBC_01490 TaxID=2903557 RepID=UPI002E3431C1|nr:alpha/beta hydrolase [Actinoallomurus sp. NBC_01490]